MHIAIVVPRYSPDVAGGAERLARGLAQTAVRHGWQAEIWTTCALNHHTWENQLPAGLTVEDGYPVHRFPITYFDPLERAPFDGLLGTQQTLPLEEQYRWLACGPHSEPLYAHVAENAAALDAVLVLPYLSALTYYAAWAAPEKMIYWPCLHNELHAFFEPFALLMESVRGVLFNSVEEEIFARHRLRCTLSRAAVVGVGVDPLPVVEPVESVAEPYILYIGRLEIAKNLPQLYDYWHLGAAANQSVKLILVGDGASHPPDHPVFAWRGFVSEAEKARLCAGALAICQPSHKESFSLAIMEGWLAGRPALVARECTVTMGHVRRSRAGLWFRDQAELLGAVEWLQEHPAQAQEMGRRGRAYVQHHFTWAAVWQRLVKAIAQW